MQLLDQNIGDARLQRRSERRDASFAGVVQKPSRELRRMAGHGDRLRRMAQMTLRQAAHALAVIAQGVRARQHTGTFSDQRRAAIGRRDQGCKQQRLIGVQPRRLLAEQTGARGGDAAQLAAKADFVDIGLKDLALAPLCLKALRRAHLRPFGEHIAPSATRRRRSVEQTRELHGKRARATATIAGQVLPQCGDQRAPVDTVVSFEALVFDRYQRAQESRRNVFKTHPGQTQSLEV